MLHIVMAILKFIGILLAAILGILVLLIGIVLFMPLRYRLKATADGNIDSLKAKLDFSWLFHLLSGYVTYENKEPHWHIKIFWKKISGETKISADEVKETVEDVTEEAVEEAIEKTEIITEALEEVNENVEKPAKNVSKETSEKNNEKTSILERIKYTIQAICDKIKMIKEMKDEVESFIYNEVHIAAFKRIKKELFRLLLYLKPKKFHLVLHYGLKDPAATGQVLAIISMLYPFMEENIDITPNFQQEVLEGDTYIKGHIRVFYILIVALRIFVDKNVLRTLKDIKKWKAKK